jgi:hypothetical protein
MKCYFAQSHLKGVSDTLLLLQSFAFIGIWKREKMSNVEDYHINNSPRLMTVTSLVDTVTRGQLLATQGYYGPYNSYIF